MRGHLLRHREHLRDLGLRVPLYHEEAQLRPLLCHHGRAGPAGDHGEKVRHPQEGARIQVRRKSRRDDRLHRRRPRPLSAGERQLRDGGPRDVSVERRRPGNGQHRRQPRILRRPRGTDHDLEPRQVPDHGHEPGRTHPEVRYGLRHRPPVLRPRLRRVLHRYHGVREDRRPSQLRPAQPAEEPGPGPHRTLHRQNGQRHLRQRQGCRVPHAGQALSVHRLRHAPPQFAGVPRPHEQVRRRGHHRPPPENDQHHRGRGPLLHGAQRVVGL